MSILDPNAPVGERLHFVLANFGTKATLQRLLACIGGGLLLSTMLAARDVIGHRTTLLHEAMQQPLAADHRELSQMVPEKVAAFSAAGSAAVGAWWEMQSIFVAQTQMIGAAMLTGRSPDVAELGRLQRRTAARAMQLAERAVAAGGAMLDPVHAKAIGNARRLARKK